MEKESARPKQRIYFKNDRTIGLLAFSAFSGLIYAIPQAMAQNVRQWVDFQQSDQIPDGILYSLGAGWAIPLENAKFYSPHLLPNRKDWQVIPEPQWPILINWFITGTCPLACQYCYAEDLMWGKSKEPDSEHALAEAAEAILALQPVVVVLTGGDPLFGPNFFRAVPMLSGKVGLMLDTSGYTLTDRHIETIKEHGIAVRISLDSERPKIQESQRPLHSQTKKPNQKTGTSLDASVAAIERCLKENIPVTVQTVATIYNANELATLGDKLRRWGVHSWRIFKVSPSAAKMDEYKMLIGETYKSGRVAKERSLKGPFQYIFEDLVSKFGGGQGSNFSLQITENEKPNAVILVAPDGTFYTESNLGPKKIVIDKEHPKQPRLEDIHAVVNMGAHAERYLNLTTTKYERGKNNEP